MAGETMKQYNVEVTGPKGSFIYTIWASTPETAAEMVLAKVSNIPAKANRPNWYAKVNQVLPLSHWTEKDPKVGA